MRLPLVFLGLAPLLALSEPSRSSAYYQVGRIPPPIGIEAQIGGLTTMADGRLAACFHHGQVGIFDPETTTWTIFAEGLHEPLGVVAEPDGSLVVMQRPELTRLRDTDGDGVADHYETLWDDFGLSGNYHEFAFGPARGPDGKLYVALNAASRGASIRRELRGAWSPVGLSKESFFREDWSAFSKQEGIGMYSRVAWRGWVMQIDPQTGKGTPFASGFRSPDGLGFDLEGNLLVTDNQGDWRGTDEVYVVERGGFYGHPASLVWREDWDGRDPLKVPVDELEALRTPPAISLPHGTYVNSPTEVVTIPRTPAWGPFGGQLLMGEMNFPRLFRLLPEKVDGRWQGACVALVDNEDLKLGLHRLAFIGDTLYIGRTHLAWVGGEGIGTLVPTGRLPFVPLNMQVTPTGFRFEFTKPLSAAAADPQRWRAQAYYYKYHAAYGSPEMGKTTVQPRTVTLSKGGLVAEVHLPDFKPGLVYDFDLSGLRSLDDEAPLNPRIAYTLHRIPDVR